MPIARNELVSYTNQLLNIERFADYCPNGLQVEGAAEVRKIVSGVTASQALLEAAVAAGADTVLVHHGYFWKSEAAPIVGMKQRRIKTLLNNEMNLLAYHLPLDAHPELGNNAQLAKRLGLSVEAGMDAELATSIGLVGRLPEAVAGADFAAHVEQVLGRKPLFVAGNEQPIQRIAWCTGGAQGYIDKALALGVDAYLTGEVSEATVHTARECGIHFFSAGHHATERYGVQALGEHLAQHFGLEHEFIDVDNPA